MLELENTVDEFPMRSLRVVVGYGGGGINLVLLVLLGGVLLVSKVLPKKKGI